MKYYLEYDIKNGWWKIYDMQNKEEGKPPQAIASYSTELFDKLLEELITKSKEANG